jgi:hypothetical protein
MYYIFKHVKYPVTIKIKADSEEEARGMLFKIAVDSENYNLEEII